MAKENKVVFALEDVTLHQVAGRFNSPTGQEVEDVTGVSLKPGDTVPLDSLSSYQKEAAENGELFGVEVLTEKEAEKKREEVEEFLKTAALVASGSAGVPNPFQTVTLSGPDVDDGSHSDHLVPDEVRRANLAEQGESEPADDGDSSEPKAVKKGAEKEGNQAKSDSKE